MWGYVEGADNLEKYNLHHASLLQRRAEAMLAGEELPSEPVLKNLPRQTQFLRLASVTYDVNNPSHIQTFSIPKEIQDLGIDIGVVVFEIEDNWGDDQYTCLYRVRVHGEMKDGPPPILPNPDEEASS